MNRTAITTINKTQMAYPTTGYGISSRSPLPSSSLLNLKKELSGPPAVIEKIAVIAKPGFANGDACMTKTQT